MTKQEILDGVAKSRGFSSFMDMVDSGYRNIEFAVYQAMDDYLRECKKDEYSASPNGEFFHVHSIKANNHKPLWGGKWLPELPAKTFTTPDLPPGIFGLITQSPIPGTESIVRWFKASGEEIKNPKNQEK